MGKMMIRPDYPEGLANFSKITMQLPYFIPHVFTDDKGFEKYTNFIPRPVVIKLTSKSNSPFKLNCLFHAVSKNQVRPIPVIQTGTP